MFVAVVVASALAGLDVSRVALAVAWPTLTVVHLALTDDPPTPEAKPDAGSPAE